MNGIEVKCPECGFTAAIGADTLKQKGEEAASALTDAVMAQRFRDVASMCVRAVLPEAMWRLPLARVNSVPDKVAAELARRAQHIFLALPEA